MALEDIGKYGAGQLRFGSLVLGGKQWGFPERYDMYKTESISLGDTVTRGVIPWTVVGNALLCNYNLLSDILWGELHAMRLISGRTFHIDGFRFRCRVPISDSDPSKPTEWDIAMAIHNGDNQFWNWRNAPSWVNSEMEFPSMRCVCGGKGAVNLEWKMLSDTAGWRPVLEPRAVFRPNEDAPLVGSNLLVWGCSSVVRGQVLAVTPYDFVLKAGSGWRALPNPMFRVVEGDVVIVDRSRFEFYQVAED